MIQKILGQGGFGRTYLALDQERFHERCVLKEFIVSYQDSELVEKAKALFQREASALYQIQHPQIPRFWAAFEDRQRLFLVQDFIEGDTYRNLLQQRLQRGQAFSEAEVLHLLGYLLPVLSYIHERNLIHRDISPDNLVLHAQQETGATALPGLPFLIDFGSVKTAASYVVPGADMTRVGKAGYCPPEQLQTGKVYPHSDLYALAATSLTLLTGREPYALLDGQTLTWQWQPYAKLSPCLAAVLQQMLAVQPRDRYPSAYEVWLDLQPLLTILPGSTSPATKLTSTTGLRSSSSLTTRGNFLPEIATELEGYFSTNPTTHQGSRVTSKLSPSSQKAALPKVTAPWLGVGIGAISSVILGVGLATFGMKVIEQHFSPSSPTNTNNQTSSPTSASPNGLAKQTGIGTNLYLSPAESQPESPIASTNNEVASNSDQMQQIQFAPGAISTVLQGNLQGYGEKVYILKASQGQIMTATLEGAGVVMNLLRPNQQEIDAASSQTRSWTGQLPTDDYYLIQVSGSGSYSLDVTIPPSAESTQPVAQPVTFARGTNGTTLSDKLLPNQPKRYSLRLKRGQLLVVKTLQGKIKLSAIAPSGQQVGNSAFPLKYWQNKLPTDGVYTLELTSNQAGNFQISVHVY